MQDETTGVETSQEAPTDNAVETNTTDAAQVDWQAEYANLYEEHVKTASDRDNYKAGLLSAKKRGQTIDEEEIARLVEEKVQTAVKQTLEGQDIDPEKLRQQREFTQKVLRENEELRLANKNKPPMTTVTSGSSEKDESSVVPKFTKEQLAAMAQRGASGKGIDPQKVWETYSKLRG